MRQGPGGLTELLGAEKTGDRLSGEFAVGLWPGVGPRQLVDYYRLTFQK